jgi:cobalamin biosynthesis protein CobT
MCGAYYALRTSVALAESWSALNVPNEWLGFTALDHVDPDIPPEDLDGPFFCRPPLLHLVFKAYDERLKDVRSRFGGIMGRGSNVDGEGVLWAFRRLSARREKRKILVVVLDGQPASSNGCRKNLQLADELAMQTHLRDVISAATKSGIEVIGIGAGTKLPRAYFNKGTGAKFVYVHSIGTLAMDVYRVMTQRVTDLA